MKKDKVVLINVFTDEWKAYFLYSSAKNGERVARELYPDLADRDYTKQRGLTFWNKNQIPFIWINKDVVKGEQKLYSTIHESYHLVSYIGDFVGIKDEEWFAETMEYVVKQIKKIIQ